LCSHSSHASLDVVINNPTFYATLLAQSSSLLPYIGGPCRNHSVTWEQCFSLLANFFHIFDLKNVTSWEKWPKFARFWKTTKQNQNH
jgi:hypothetical protein